MIDFRHFVKLVIDSRWVSRMRRNVRRCRDEDLGSKWWSSGGSCFELLL